MVKVTRKILGFFLLSIALVFGALIVWRLMLNTSAIAQEKGQDSPPQQETQNIGDIQHATELIPTPLSRTEIGIGEAVDCWIDPGTWTGPSGDSIGAVSWALYGQGTLSTTAGGSTTYTADITSTPYSATVIATINDSKGWTPAIQKQVVFAVQTPNGYKFQWNSDKVPGVPGPPNNQIGVHSAFDCYVQPQNVNFANVNFRENIPGDTWVWPDGTKGNRPTAVVTYNVGADTAGNNNWTPDDMDMPLFPIGILNGQDYSFNVRIPEEYQSNGNWLSFFPNEVHFRKFIGASGKGTCGINPGGAVTKVPEGPWQ
jgi:hypothetical protein